MGESVGSLIVNQLREVRSDLAALKSGMGELKNGQAGLDRKIDGLNVLLGLLAAHVRQIEARVEKLEKGGT